MVYVSINGHTIRKNARQGTLDAPIRIARTRSDSKPRYASEIELVGKVRLLYDPGQVIMRCGARLVLQADDVRIVR